MRPDIEEALAGVTKPTVHLGGSSRERLVEGFMEGHRAIEDAITKVCEAAPHGRDYYTQGPEAITHATQEHRARVQALQKISQELLFLALHTSQQGR